MQFSVGNRPMFIRQADAEERKRAADMRIAFRQTLLCRQDLGDMREHPPVCWGTINGNLQECEMNPALPNDEFHRTKFFPPDLDIVAILEDHIKALIEALCSARLPNRVPPTSPQWTATGTIADTSFRFVIPALRR